MYYLFYVKEEYVTKQVYYSTQNSLSVIDVTKTVTCLHQGIAGISLADNGHSHKTEDLTYNMKYIAQNNLRQGFIDCVRTFSRYTAGMLWCTYFHMQIMQCRHWLIILIMHCRAFGSR